MRQIDLSQWAVFGEGGNGKTYRPLDESQDDILLKVNSDAGASLEAVRYEFDSSAAVCSLGVETPAMYEIVRIGDEEKYGLLFQRIRNKKSLCRICADDPSKIEEMAALFAAKGRELHAIECTGDFFHPVSEYVGKGLGTFRPFLSKSQCAKIERWISELPDRRSCLHGDLNPGNLIISEGKTYWIDLGRFAYGDETMDVAHLYVFCVAMSHTKTVQNLAHMTEAQLKAFWAAYVKAEGHTEKKDIEDYENKVQKYMALDLIARHGFQPDRAVALFTSFTVRKILKKFD